MITLRHLGVPPRPCALVFTDVTMTNDKVPYCYDAENETET